MFTVMPMWAPNTLDDFASLSVFLCAPARALCSLAEDEVKTEADVVEGMDASVRSKGKPQRPGKPAITTPSFSSQRVESRGRLPSGSCSLVHLIFFFLLLFEDRCAWLSALLFFFVYVYMVLTECFFLLVINKFWTGVKVVTN